MNLPRGGYIGSGGSTFWTTGELQGQLWGDTFSDLSYLPQDLRAASGHSGEPGSAFYNPSSSEFSPVPFSGWFRSETPGILGTGTVSRNQPATVRTTATQPATALLIVAGVLVALKMVFF